MCSFDGVAAGAYRLLVELKGKVGSYQTGESPFEFGRVSVLYEATDDKGTVVCLKLIREPNANDFDEFMKQVVAQMGVDHPNILRILDVGTAPKNGEPFIVMPFCRGGNLRSLLSNRSHLPVGEAIQILTQVASALDFAHARGIIHADIKPENILLLDEAQHEAKLGDFGMSRYFPINEPVSARIEDAAAGTSAYLSPEQVGEAKQSPRSDIYSFAVVAYELLTGTRPIPENTPAYVQMKAKVEGTIDPPEKHNPNLPPHVCAALVRGLHKNPSERPNSAARLCEELSGTSAPPRFTTRRGFFTDMAERHKVALLTTLITAVLGAAATVLAAAFGKH